MNENKPIISVDFDGVIHSYERGWQYGEIYGDIVPGFFDWAENVMSQFNIVIFSSRSSNPYMLEGMSRWMWLKYAEWCKSKNYKASPDMFYEVFGFPQDKPLAFLTIDDRVICFKGDWFAPDLKTEALLEFKPWNSN